MKRKEKDPVQKRRIGSLFQLFRYIMHYKWQLLAVLIVVVASNLIALLIPKISGAMVDTIDVKDFAIDFSALLQGAMYILLISAAIWGLSALQNVLMLKTAQNMVVDLRHDVFELSLIHI